MQCIIDDTLSQAMPDLIIDDTLSQAMPDLIIDDTLSQAMPDLHQMLIRFIDIMNSTSIANVSVDASMPKENILAFNVIQEYTNN